LLMCNYAIIEPLYCWGATKVLLKYFIAYVQSLIY